MEGSDILAQLGGIGNVAPVTLLTGLLIAGLWLFFRTMIRGDLVPAKTLERIQKSEDYWRTLAVDRLDEQGKQLDALLTASETSTGVIRAIQALAKERQP